MAKTVDSLELKSLVDVKIDKSGASKGGIEDLGNFQEGFCFLLRAKTLTSSFKWVICTDDYRSKCDLMKKLIVLKFKIQAKCNKSSQKEMSTITKIKLVDDKYDHSHNTTISRWINLQEWSSCTLACGGGSQTLHRFCLRSAEGPSCKGEAIITRPCNTQPCQNVTDEIIDTKLLPTEIRIVPVSLRPQKFKKCILKEEDMNIIRYDFSNLKLPPRIPSRVIMNNRTISIFEAGTYDSLLATYYLKKLKIVKVFEEDKRCLKIGESDEKFNVMCVMCNEDESEQRIKKWIDDIKDFSYNCHEISIKKIDIEEDPRVIKLKREIMEEILKNSIEKHRELEKKENEKDKIKTLKLAQLIALKTLEKERKFEDRLEKEERMREEKEDEEMKNEYLCEERKKANLLNIIIQKKSADNKNELELKEKLSDIEKDLKLKILLNRKRIMKKINILRLAHERRKDKFRQQIFDVKKTLTQNVMTAEKTGDLNKCKDIMQKNTFYEYCNLAFSTDPLSHNQCKAKENFCFICCENEFGELHLEERETCFSNCDETSQKGKWKYILEDEQGENKIPEINTNFNLYEKTVNKQ